MEDWKIKFKPWKKALSSSSNPQSKTTNLKFETIEFS